ncbi:PilN domain-containing protein [Microcoleus sp. B9-D4]|uniref:PilN domain-containing protein n=1 Tax=Microcoleus sp. B9-D4 TaxID=2818711 RepID=UPI002FD29CB0
MYSLDINFLNDRPDYKPVATKSPAKKSSGGAKDQLPIYGAVLFAFGINAAVIGAWWLATKENTDLAAQQATIDTELATLNTQASTIKAINAETDQVTAEYKALAGVFDQIKPWSAMLQDLSARTPAGVQIGKIEQIDPSPSPVAAAPPPPAPTPAASPGASPSPASPAPAAAPVPVVPQQASKVQISGIASTFAQVNDFMLLVQRSPFFLNTDTKLIAATLKNNPAQLQVRNQNAAPTELPKLRPVVEYKIETTLSPTGASELLPELRSKQADGLAIRIETLQEKGVLEPQKPEVKKQ